MKTHYLINVLEIFLASIYHYSTVQSKITTNLKMINAALSIQILRSYS